MNKKKIDVSKVTSSLRGESVFFPTKNDLPAPNQAGEPIENKESAREPALQVSLTPSIQEVKDTRIQDSKHTSTQGHMDTSMQVPKYSRPKKTHTYELFIDQVRAVQRLALEDKLHGGEGNQSKIVREAIDEYLKKVGQK